VSKKQQQEAVSLDVADTVSVEKEPLTPAPLHPSEVRFVEPQPAVKPKSVKKSSRGNIVESY
jgi:hypothetical protein